MTTPASNENEPSKMKKLVSGNSDDSVRGRLPRTNGSAVPAQPGSSQTQYVSVSDPRPRESRFQFLPAFWTIASLMSITVNIILVVILLIMFQMLGSIQGTADDKVSGFIRTLSRWIRRISGQIFTLRKKFPSSLV